MPLAIRIKSRVAAAVAVGCAGLALASVAEAVDLRDWGRKYPASERFVVLAQFSNQAVLDRETQLVWQRSPDSIRRIWRDAESLCLFSSTGGRKGWRLPSRSEFMSLIDPAGSASIKLPTGHPFVGVNGNGIGYYWTSDPYIPSTVPPAGYSNSMANVYITTGGVYISNMSSEAAIAWCVRGHGQ